MNREKNTFEQKGKIDRLITVVPLAVIILIAALLLRFPNASMKVVDTLWYVFVNKLGFFYMLLGLGLVFTAIGLAFSKYGSIKLGGGEKPRYSDFEWGSMIFTSTMAADILYWSLIEWAYYFNESPFGMTGLSLAEKQDWASAFPLFPRRHISLGVLYRTGCRFRLYAPCARPNKTKIVRKLPADFRQ